MQVAKFLHVVRDSERIFAEALLMFSDRHGQNPELRHGARLFASWSQRHADEARSQLSKYGRRFQLKADPEPERLRSALFHGPRIGGLGLVRDLQDLIILAEEVRHGWLVIHQAAQALRDSELERVALAAMNETHRQRAWLETHLKDSAPQALLVEPARVPEVKASRPAKASAAAMPDLLWGPAASALILLVAGVLALVAKEPWLLPSLGPTAYLMGEDAGHPSSRIYDTVVGHAVGAGAAILALALFGGFDDPVVLATQTVTAARVFAGIVAVLLTVLVCLALRASHPPAGATALLVAFGSLQSPSSLLSLAIGVGIVAVVGGALRQVRRGRLRGILARRRLARLDPVRPR